MHTPERLEADIITANAHAEWAALHGSERTSVWPRLIVKDHTESTNDDAIALLSSGELGGPDMPDATGTLIVTLDQRSGKGRLGRAWEAPAGSGLAMTLVIQAPSSVPTESLAMASTLVGLVWRDVLAASTASDVSLKWPNDVLMDGEKVAGILAQVAPSSPGPRGAAASADGSKTGIDKTGLADKTGSADKTGVANKAGIADKTGVKNGIDKTGTATGEPAKATRAGGLNLVVGIGTNLTQTKDELPVPTATSLALHNCTTDVHRLISAFWTRALAVLSEWLPAGGPLDQPLGSLGCTSLIDATRKHCATIGVDVRVHLPQDVEITGVARDVDEYGYLIVEDSAGKRHQISAGDVIHVRRSDGHYA